MRTIGVVTTSRADYGIYRPVLRAIAAEPDLRLSIFVGGSHLREAHGRTVSHIEADGWPIVARIDMLEDDDAPTAIAAAMGRAVTGFARAFDQHRPDLLLVLGDRFEMHAAALAALPLRIPVAHIHGGELSCGAIDDALRHSITKLSHLHFVATDEARRRVIQMGEQPERVHLTGAPGLDNCNTIVPLDRVAMRDVYGVALPERFLLVVFHPATLAHEQTHAHTAELLAAIEVCGIDPVFVDTNADTGGAAIRAAVDAYVRTHPDAVSVRGKDTAFYFSAMALAEVLVGNSSSGIIEAASFGLPVVNVGSRQDGRLRPNNVIDAPPRRDAIAGAIARATDPAFRATVRRMSNPYGDGRAAPRIVEVLRHIDPSSLIVKKFHDLRSERQP
jgi:UDP-hydrolysing UDP-N-acetyl-D-glucosamine 2-epimerase